VATRSVDLEGALQKARWILEGSCEAERSSIARHLRMRGEVWMSGVRRRPAMAVVGASRS